MILSPAEGGSYALVMRLEQAAEIAVGRLGVVRFMPGVYVYTGSAFGPGGIRARIAHHRRIADRPRWHIDWLRRAAPLLAVGWKAGVEERLECAWAARLGQYPGASCAVSGFGSSDCRSGCAAHLARLPLNASPAEVFAWLGIGPGDRTLAGV